MLFLCPKGNKFERDFKECEQCKDKETCINYKYELGFQERKKENGN